MKSAFIVILCLSVIGCATTNHPKNNDNEKNLVSVPSDQESTKRNLYIDEIKKNQANNNSVACGSIKGQLKVHGKYKSAATFWAERIVDLKGDVIFLNKSWRGFGEGTYCVLNCRRRSQGSWLIKYKDDTDVLEISFGYGKGRYVNVKNNPNITMTYDISRSKIAMFIENDLAWSLGSGIKLSKGSYFVFEGKGCAKK